MPIQHEITGSTLRFTTTGSVEYEKGTAVLARGLAEARQRLLHEGARPFDLLFDIRKSTEDRSAAELRAIATLVANQRDVLSGRGVIVTSDALHFGLARMFAAFAEGTGADMHVVSSEEAAWEWLEQGRTARA